VFLTNNFAQDALTIAKLYKCRWQVELFFKWIKLQIPVHRGQSFRRIADSIPVIADSF